MCLPVLLKRRVLGPRRLHSRPVHCRVFPVQEDGAVPAPPSHCCLRGTSGGLRREVAAYILDVRPASLLELGDVVDPL